MKIDDFYKIVDVLQREEFNDGSLKTLLFLSVLRGVEAPPPTAVIEKRYTQKMLTFLRKGVP